MPQLDLERISDSLDRAGADRSARGGAVVEALGRVAEQSQLKILPLLMRLQRQHAVESYARFTIVNRLLVTATPDGIRALAASPEVRGVIEESPPAPPVLQAIPPQALRAAPSWALGALEVQQGWRLGLTGRGVVVGLIDAGVSAAHEQLRANYRAGSNSWFDPINATATPTDIIVGHGTGVLSAAVGRGTAAHVIGVAPDAQWIACAGFPEGRYNNITVTECAEWMLTTGKPDILLNPWQLPSAGCDHSLQRIVAAWRAAGILPVFAAGNNGPGRGSDRSPANYGLSVGAVRSNGAVFRRSSRGPNSCDGSVYPTVVAPGEDIPVAFPLTPSGYVRISGTSVAAGLTAGVAALLLQRDPQASPRELEDALRRGARDAGTRGPDNSFGYGRLSVTGAVTAVDRARTTHHPTSSATAVAQP